MDGTNIILNWKRLDSRRGKKQEILNMDIYVDIKLAKDSVCFASGRVIFKEVLYFRYVFQQT